MLFNSFEFLLFFPIVSILYFLLPYKVRWLHLLVASCVFYMMFIPIYILILIFTIIIDYIAGILIENATGNKRKMFLVMSIVANVGILVFFKYYAFLTSNINFLFSIFHAKANLPLLNIILPIGLSFHTFQAMSYTIEVYRGNQKSERHFGIYSLYVLFYPQLVAGPIERPQNLLHQFHEKKYFNYDNAVVGLRLIMWGMFKKVVIADRLSGITSLIFNDPHKYSGIALAIGAIFFAFQVYCDFSGYSDIAIGSARFMGFKLMTNFNKPFYSRNITEFWRRWHISLSTWLSDYLFKPIALSLRNFGKNSVLIAALITFFISGIWHGAAWHFVAYGILHGLAIIYEILTNKIRKKIFKKLPKAISTLIGRFFTFLYICFAFVFFRAHNLKDALYISFKFTKIPGEIKQIFVKYNLDFLKLPDTDKLIRCFSIIVFLELVQFVSEKYNLIQNFNIIPKPVRWFLYYCGLLGTFYYGVFEKHEFIYFQF